MVERKAILANPKHQYHVSQYGELDCSPHNEKNGGYYEYLSLTMNINYKIDGVKKSYSYKSKESILCISMWRT